MDNGWRDVDALSNRYEVCHLMRGSGMLVLAIPKTGWICRGWWESFGMEIRKNGTVSMDG